MAEGQDVRRAGIAVVVPTTDQPILVKKLTWSAQLPHSRVVLGNSDPCEGWTRQYNALLGAGEPFRHCLSLPAGGSYRLVVSAAVDQGRSWMVPVAAAHCGLAQGEAIAGRIAEARLLVWGTGAIGMATADQAADARIEQQEYHLTTKIDRSRHLFAEAAHGATPVLALVPQGEEAERAAGILAKVLAGQPHHVAIVASLADILAPLELFLRSGRFEEERREPSREITLIPKPKAERDAGRKAEAPAEAAATPEAAFAAAGGAGAGRRSVLGEAPERRGAGAPLLLGLGLVATLAAAGLAYWLLRKPEAPLVTAAGDPVTALPAATAAQPRTAPAAPPAASQSASVSQVPAVAPPPAANPPAAGGPALARLKLLAAPAGSSCRAQVYEINPRFVEAVVEVAGGAAAVEIGSEEVCGVALEPVGPVRLRFQQGTGSPPVPSQSNPTRVIFNPTALGAGPAALPTIQIEEPQAALIEIKRR